MKKYRAHIERETKQHLNIGAYRACEVIYSRTVVYLVEWGGSVRTPLFTYKKYQIRDIPVFHHPAPWADTVECLEICQRGQVVGYKKNYWVIEDIQWINKFEYDRLKEIKKP